MIDSVKEIWKVRSQVQFPRNRVHGEKIDIVERAVWIKDEISFQSRLDAEISINKPKLNQFAVYTYINRVPVYISNRHFMLRYIISDQIGFQIETLDPLLRGLQGKEGIPEKEFKRENNLRSIASWLKPYLKSGKIVIQYSRGEKLLWISEELFANLTAGMEEGLFDKDESLKMLIAEILTGYPYLQIDQIAFLTGLHTHELGKPLFELMKEGKVEKAVVKGEHAERFYLKGSISSEVSEVAISRVDDPHAWLVLNDMDVSLKDQKYILFYYGIPIAALHLKKNRNNLDMTNFTLLTYSDLGVDEAISLVIKWGSQNSYNIVFNRKESPQGKLSLSLIEELVSRGYQFNGESLAIKIEGDQTNDGFFYGYSSHLLFLGAKHSDPESFTKHSIYILNELSYSRALTPSDKIVRGYFNDRLVLAHMDDMPLFRSMHIGKRMGLKAEGVLNIVKKHPGISTDLILEQGGLGSEKALHALEITSRICRLNRAEEFSSATWVPVPDIGISRAQATTKLVQRMLSWGIPLDSSRISRYLRIEITAVEKAILKLLEREEIIEGYFMKDSKLQYKLKGTITIESFDETTILPSSDFRSLFLSDLIKQKKELQRSAPVPENAITFSLFFRGTICGYMILTDSEEIEINMDETVLSTNSLRELLTQFTTSFHGYNGSRIRKINSIDIRSPKYERLRFIIELLGYQI